MKNILSISEICKRTSLSRATIWRRRRQGAFPQAIQLGLAKRIGLLEDEVAQWIASHIKARDAVHSFGVSI